MPPREEEDLTRHTIRLYTGDADRLDQFYPDQGHSRAIRKLVRLHIKKLEERAARHAKPVTLENIDIGL